MTTIAITSELREKYMTSLRVGYNWCLACQSICELENPGEPHQCCENCGSHRVQWQPPTIQNEPMPNITRQQYLDHEARVAKGKPKTAPPNAAARETGKGGLHEQIINWCDSQWPRVKYIHSRTDQKSTVAVGSHDFTLFLHGGTTLCVECKAKGGKLSTEQRIWIHEMALKGHMVHVVFSMEEFKELVKV